MLHQAIKELRAELDRVNLAIQRIEVIAAAITFDEQAGNEPCGTKSQIDKPARVEN
ncbi:MAG: hypothetical protein O2795_00865 [Acidobacteria bacterium]|nr:hypothetical protein [Acidobacteriota bacterium]